MSAYTEPNELVRSDAEFIDEGGEFADFYEVPLDLLEQSLPPVESRFILRPLPVEARVVLSDPPSPGSIDEAAHDAAVSRIEKILPVRAARLRDLHRRVEAAKRRFLDIQQREEALRCNRNRYHNFVNLRLNQELEDQRTEWGARRKDLLAELERLETELLEAERPHYEALILAQEAVSEAQQIVRSQEESVPEAAGGLLEQERQAIERHQSLVEAALRDEEEMRRQTAERLEQEAAELERHAREIEAKLLDEATM
jgi:hypothetical protein